MHTELGRDSKMLQPMALKMEQEAVSLGMEALLEARTLK